MFQGDVVTRDGYSNMVFFPEDFPWKNKSLREMLGDKFMKVQEFEKRIFVTTIEM